jgi:hypothetical protein
MNPPKSKIPKPNPTESAKSANPPVPAGGDKRVGQTIPSAVAGANPRASVPAGNKGGGSAAGSAPRPPLAPLFRRIDWLTMAATTLLIFAGYFWTLAPDVTLEDSGELATGSFYAGVPHPPGYPVWTLYTWLFTVILPFKNPAWRVGVASAVAGSLGCGFLALITSRGSSMILEGIAAFKELDKKEENAVCVVSGFVAGMLMGFNGYMWSQSIIVEVYTLSVLSLMGVLGCILRWIYAPHQRRYLYAALFLFGICLTNHMSLLVAAMGIQVAIMCVQPRLGRDMFAVNGVIWVVGLILAHKHIITNFDNNPPIFALFNVIGILSLLACLWLVVSTQGFGTELWPVCVMAFMWLCGAGFYLYMPVASMSNPPMNWGYARTVDGFKHAVERGQNEAVHPTDSILKYLKQTWIYASGAIDEFSLLYLCVGLMPFLFFRFMQKREKAWIIGLSAIYSCLAFLLLYLLNPGSDRQSLELNKVFFTASYVMVSMGIGYGVALISASIATRYAEIRRWVLLGAVAALGLSVYALEDTIHSAFTDVHRNGFVLLFYGVKHAFIDQENQLQVFAGLFVVGLTAAFLAAVLLFRRLLPTALMLGLFALMPVHSVLGHWFDNEQRGHLFGFWFGHDMFTPPFNIYPEMTRDAVLFGGTDPGRFCPTYMIFCESFIPPEKRTEDPKFDRRDVYLITQNALADVTYLEYIRAHYNRSTQIDPPFFQILFGRPFKFLDTFFTSIGAGIEARRRAGGVYPKREIHTPSHDDSDRAFRDYITDAQERFRLGQMKAGEDFHPDQNGMIQVSGNVAVMLINGLLARDIFDANPDHEFYVEESFALDWMYPYESPFGVIMKVNRQPLPEISQEMVDKDHKFWSLYSDRLIGNWITYDTSVTNLCEFAERLYLRHDFRGFKGDPKFIRDDDAQKAFSKLRSSQGGLYSWRMQNAKTEPEKARMMKEAVFAFKQAFAYCPFSPEAVYHFVMLLIANSHFDEALAVARTCLKLDSGNTTIKALIDELQAMKKTARVVDLPATLAEASSLITRGETNQGLLIVDQLVSNPGIDARGILSCAQVYVKANAVGRLETALNRLVQLVPENPEAWLDLAGLRALLGKTDLCFDALDRCVKLSNQRLKAEPASRNLAKEVLTDSRFGAVKSLPRFQQIISQN